MPQTERSERGKTHIEITSVRRENAPDSRVIVTMEREAAGLKAGDAVMMTSNLPEEVANELYRRLKFAIQSTWGIVRADTTPSQFE